MKDLGRCERREEVKWRTGITLIWCDWMRKSWYYMSDRSFEILDFDNKSADHLHLCEEASWQPATAGQS